jgi:hypothetical protein
MTSRARLSAIVVVLALGLAGCTAVPDMTATPAPTTAPTVAATPAPTRPPAETVADPTCTTLLDTASIDRFAAHGYELSDDFEQRAAEEGWPLLAFVTNGGLLCQWGYPQSDASEFYGLSEITAEQQAAEIQRLTGEGYSRQPHGDGELFVGPSIEGINEHYFFADAHWFVGFSPARIDEIRCNAGLG